MKKLLLLATTLLTMSCAQNDSVNDSDDLSMSTENGTVLTDMETDSEETEETDDNWTVIFSDYFEGDSSIPDESKWVLCEKGKDSWNRYLSESYDQAYQKDGSLYLIAEKVNGEYQTGGIETRGKFEFEHGKVECRARFVKRPQGNHTGIWMMPAPPAEQWPKSGEIDIMEHLSNEKIIYETVHSWYADDMGYGNDPKCRDTADIDDEDWNIYGLIWTADELIYTVNGKEYLKYPNLHLEGENGDYQWPFNHPFYLILSQSLGGEGTWAGPIDDEELPAVFEIDWIKVMQDSSEASVPQIRI